MPKVGVVVEQLNEEDEKLRRELEEFGETVIDKITDKSRLILIKKLNHLRARRRMSEKLSQSVLSPKKPAASKRGRGRKGKSVKNEPSHEASLDELHTGSGDQLNETFRVSDSSVDVEPAAKQSRNIPTNNIPYAHVGPYAVARKRVAGKSQVTVQHSDKTCEQSKTGGASMAQFDELLSEPSSLDFSQNFCLPTKSGVLKRGRTRTVGDLRGSANAVSFAATEMESVDGSSVQKASLSVKRNACASVAAAAAAAVPDSSTHEGTVAENTSLSVPATNVKVAVLSAEGRDRGTSRGRKHKPGELSKSLEDAGKQIAASRIPKLARFPTPPPQKSAASTAVSESVAAAVVHKVTARVMDTVSGRPAAGMALKLFSENQSGTWSLVTDCTTDDKGTVTECCKSKHLTAGTYRLQFNTGLYFQQHGVKTMFPHTDVVFNVDPAEPVQIDLAISPYAYSTHAHVNHSH